MSLAQLQQHFNCRIQPLTPFGMEIHAPDEPMSVEAIPVELLRPLLLTHRLVLLRGFQAIEEQGLFAKLCLPWGQLLEWDFGTVFEVVEHTEPQNYLFTRGSVPYHWDGAFADQTPWLQFFQCREASDNPVGGETIFCNTHAIWESLSPAMQQLWKAIEIEYSTDKVAHYGGRIRAPLVDRHPHTDEIVLRFAEPPNAATVPLNTPKLEVYGIPQQTVPAFLDDLVKLLYDTRFVYSHPWQTGDFVIADNHVLLHGRNSYDQHQPRRLWRVHIL